MPLRSVEAATRDDAIAAAREQFGPTARVVGVRRVRSGGVLGFFATERYVAEVASEQSVRSDVPVPAPAGRASAFVSSPLSAAAPATAAPSAGRAPARNGAAAWAAAAESVLSRPRTGASPIPAALPARTPEPADDDRVAELAGLLAGEPEEAPAPAPAPAYVRAAFPRATAVHTSRELPVEDDDDEWVDDWKDAPAQDAPAALPSVSDSAAPSPFTAALARMVSGDRDVRQAVQHVLDQPSAATTNPSSSGTAEPWPAWPGLQRSDDTSVTPLAARQEEETVGDQVIAPPSLLADDAPELPNWAVEPDAAAPGNSRQEAIAEVLRSALAQGHSDEALAGILRKVLAGASPKTALTDPAQAEVAAPPAAAAPMSMAMALNLAMARSETPEPEPVRFAVPEPVVEAAPTAVAPEPIASPAFPETEEFPVTEEYRVVDYTPAEDAAPELSTSDVSWAEADTPEVSSVDPVAYDAHHAADYPDADDAADDDLFADETAVDDEPVHVAPFEASYPEQPRFSFPVRFPSSAEPLWGGTPAQVSLWGDVTAAVASAVAEETIPDAPAACAASAAEAPIWAEVEVPSSIAAPETVAMPIVEATIEADEDAALDEALAAEIAAEAVTETIAVQAQEAVEDEVEDIVEEAEEVVLAPMLARTASDPAPLSLDATTVMPPLSLLPPLPGSRGSRGRPPVPPSSRPAVSSSRPAAPAASAPDVDTPSTGSTDPETPDLPSAPSWLATVTRLPVAPLMATPETPEMPEMPEMPGLFEELEEEFGKRALATAAEPAPSVEPTPTAEPRISLPAPTPAVRGDVAARLETLGVPAHLLGSSFAADVETYGAYAALTRTLGLRLPTPPEVPSGPGEILFIVGPGVETLRAAQSLASSLRLDPDRVQWATRGDLAALAPRDSRMTTIDAAIDRRSQAAAAGTITIVAVDAPMRSDSYWMAQMMAIWSPVAVWAVVDATRKPEDLEPWLDGLDRVDALIVQDTDLSADPAAVLRRVPAPVAILDGVRATSHRWASLLCERLESGQA